MADTKALVSAYQRERAGLSRMLDAAGLSADGRTRIEGRIAGVDEALANLGQAAIPQQGPQRTAEDIAPKRSTRRTR